MTSLVSRLALLIALVAPTVTLAQSPTPERATTLSIDVGAETENYLRYLQVLGEIPLSQWSIRSFGPREVDKLFSPPASVGALRSFEHAVHDVAKVRWEAQPVVLSGWYESGFPFGGNDGAVWRGRGLTTAVKGGLSLRYGVLSVRLEPIAFWAQNREFPLMTNGQVGALAYADPLVPKYIDRPQRFGADSYARIDPGQSTIRIDAFGLTAGISTANLWWGPMSEWPFLLGNNAAGFPHLFAGTSEPLNIGIGRIHTQMLYARLEQSRFTDITGLAQHRFAAGIIASFQPRGLTGLEIGVARFFHEPWPSGGIGWRELRSPIEAVFKSGLKADPGTTETNQSIDNQLASIFARWVLPANGLEVYGEFGRDDHNWDLRDLLLEPDHEATIGLGARKAWHRSDTNVSALRAELFDLDPSILGRTRGEGQFYTHYATRQGHTERGQVLGAGFAAINGVGTMMAYERYAADQQKLLISLSRMVVRERAATATVPGSLDVQYALTAERTRRVGKLGLTYGLTGVYELNRYFQSDATNLELTTRLAW